MIVRFTAVRDFHLTRNQNYTVIRETANQYIVRNDRNIAAGYDKRLFEIVDNEVPETINTVEAPQPTPARRRGRPTNAEIAARQQEALQPARQEPIETPGQRRVREEREEQERIERERQAELTRRGAIRTERDIADSIVVTTINQHSYNVSFDLRERVNDTPNIILRNISHNTTAINDFSCGINQLISIQDFLNSIHNILDYQERDYELVREELFRKIGIAFIENTERRRAGYELTSITRNTAWMKDMLLNYFGFSELLADINNPNSGNTICLLGRLR